MAVTTTMAMKNSMRTTGRRRSFHRVLLRSSGIRQSRNQRTGGNNSVRSFRLEIARLGRPSWRFYMSWMSRKTCTPAIWFSPCNRATGTPMAVSRDPKFFPCAKARSLSSRCQRIAKFCPLCREVNRIATATATRELICRSPNLLCSRPRWPACSCLWWCAPDVASCGH